MRIRSAVVLALGALGLVACQSILGIEDLEVGDRTGSSSSTGGTGGSTAMCTPKVEDCATPADDNCDGHASCTGAEVWIQEVETLSDPAQQGFHFGGALAFDGEANPIVAGFAHRHAWIGDDHDADAAGQNLGYVAGLSKTDGKPVWVKELAASGGSADVVVNAVATTASGDLVVGGGFVGTFANRTASTQTGFLAVLDGKTRMMKHLDVQEPGGPQDEATIDAIAIAADGTIVATGDVTGKVTLSNGDVLDGGHGTAVFVATFDSDAKLLADLSFTTGLFGSCDSIAIERESGDLALGCNYVGTGPKVGGKQLPDAGMEDYLGFLLRLGGDLGVKWVVPFAADLDSEVDGVGFDRDGHVLAAGSFASRLKVAGQTRNAQGEHDVFAASFEDSETLHWLRIFGDTDIQYANVAVVDGAGQLVIGGEFAGEIIAGACSIRAHAGGGNGLDAFVMKLSNGGEPIWCRSGGSAGTDERTIAVAADPLGNVYVGATVANSMSFGDAAVVCRAPACTYGLAVARLLP